LIPFFYANNAKSSASFDTANQKTKITSQLGETPISLQMTRNGLDVTGDAEVFTDSGYTGTSAANPTSIWYCSVAADCNINLGTVYANGLTIRYEATIDVEFFSRKDLGGD